MQASDEAGVEGRPGKLSSLSQREQLLMSQLFKKKQELLEMMAKYEKLKTARIRELGLSADGWVCSQCVCVGLKKKDICQVPSCKASNKSPENFNRVCTSCFISLTKTLPKSVAAGNAKKNPIKKKKKLRLYSILKPRKSTNVATKVCTSETDTATETEEDHGGRQDSEVFTKPPSVDHSETDTATETEEDHGGRQESEKLDCESGKWSPCGETEGDKLELELNNLETGKKMKFRVKAKNEEGKSDWMEGPLDTVTIKDPFDPPSPPGLPEIIDWTENSVKLKWSPPLRENGVPVTHYTLEYREYGEDNWTTGPRVKAKKYPDGEVKDLNIILFVFSF